MECEHVSKKTNLMCGKPCAVGLKKNRCSDHGGEDAPVVVTKPVTPVKKEKAPKPGSKKWQQQMGIVASGGGAGSDVNPYTKCDVSNVDYYPKGYSVLSSFPGGTLLKGTPLFVTDGDNDRYDYVAETFVVEILSNKIPGKKECWGNVNVKVVNSLENLDKPGCVQTRPINTIMVKEDDVFTDKVFPADMTYQKLHEKPIHWDCVPLGTINPQVGPLGKYLPYTERMTLMLSAGHLKEVALSSSSDHYYCIKGEFTGPVPKDAIPKARTAKEIRDGCYIGRFALIDLSSATDDELRTLISKKLEARAKNGCDNEYVSKLQKSKYVKNCVEHGGKMAAPKDRVDDD